MSDLEDGRYDVMVVDAAERGAGELSLQLAIASGNHRGDVVDLVATGMAATWIDLLGTPGTLVVRDGQPTFSSDSTGRAPGGSPE